MSRIHNYAGETNCQHMVDIVNQQCTSRLWQDLEYPSVDACAFLSIT